MCFVRKGYIIHKVASLKVHSNSNIQIKALKNVISTRNISLIIRRLYDLHENLLFLCLLSMPIIFLCLQVNTFRKYLSYPYVIHLSRLYDFYNYILFLSQLLADETANIYSNNVFMLAIFLASYHVQ